MIIDSAEGMMKLEEIQSKIEVTDVIKSGIYSCDCTSCQSVCTESCADGMGPTD